jgi:hypothetical protein
LEELHFRTARLRLQADPNNPEGITELNLARETGFADADALGDLLFDSRITSSGKEIIRKMIDDIETAQRENTP